MKLKSKIASSDQKVVIDKFLYTHDIGDSRSGLLLLLYSIFDMLFAFKKCREVFNCKIAIACIRKAST